MDHVRERHWSRRTNLRSVLVCAAVCPHPPLLVAVDAGTAPRDMSELRSACRAALDAVYVASPELLVIVGSGPTTGELPPTAIGDFRPWGIDTRVRLPGAADVDAAAETDALPLSLAVGAWLIAGRPDGVPVSAVSVAAEADVAECARLGAEVAEWADRVALLVMSDGSAQRSDDGPQRFDPRAGAYDAAVVRGLRDGEPSVLLDLDAELATAVGSAGLNPLRVLAGAAGESGYDTEIFHDAAPNGVEYYVAVWERHG